MRYRMSWIERHLVVSVSRATRFADHVTKRKGGTLWDENVSLRSLHRRLDETSDSQTSRKRIDFNCFERGNEWPKAKFQGFRWSFIWKSGMRHLTGAEIRSRIFSGSLVSRPLVKRHENPGYEGVELESLLPAICIVFETNQNRSSSGILESRSFRRAFAVKNEDSRYKIASS